MLRLAKNVTMSSMSLSDDPPVETITGFLVLAIFSSSSQSFRSELATFKMGSPSSTHRSTERSSNGVAVAMHPPCRMALTRVAY